MELPMTLATTAATITTTAAMPEAVAVVVGEGKRAK
jgi:hypothetical protein